MIYFTNKILNVLGINSEISDAVKGDNNWEIINVSYDPNKEKSVNKYNQ